MDNATLERAMALHREGLLPEAATQYLAVLQEAPTNGHALHGQGVVRYQEGKLEEALQWLSDAIVSEPGVASFHNTLSVVLFELNRIEDAIAQGEFALGIDPAYVTAARNLCSYYEAAGDSKRAQTVGEMASKAEAQQQIDRARSLAADGNLDGAYRAALDVLAVSSEKSAPHDLAANICVRRGLFAQALLHFEQCVAFERGGLSDPAGRKGPTSAWERLRLEVHRIGEAVVAKQRSETASCDSPTMFSLGVLHARNGRWTESISCLSAAVSANRTDSQLALQVVSVVVESALAIEKAKAWFETLPAEAISQPSVLRLFGCYLLKSSDIGAAVLLLRRASELQPEVADNWNSLGVALLQLRQLGEAEVVLNRALAIESDAPDFLNNLAMVNQLVGKHTEAIAYYERALVISPVYAEARANLGNAYKEYGRSDLAEQSYRESLQTDAKSLVAAEGLSALLMGAGRSSEAEIILLRQLARDPRNFTARVNLGGIAALANRFDEALEHYERATKLEPDNAVAHERLALTLLQLDRAHEAETVCREALDRGLRGTSLIAYLANAIIAQMRPLHELKALLSVYGQADAETTDRVYGSIASYARHQCDWSDYRDHETFIRSRAESNSLSDSFSPFALMSWECVSAESILRHTQRYVNARLSAQLTLRPVCQRMPQAKPVLTLGYLSGHFDTHPTMILLKGVLEQHNKERFRVHIYSNSRAKDDPYRAFAQKSCDVFRDIAHMSDLEAAHLIQRDQVDILIDLDGFTSKSRPGINVLRPAPLNVNWLGFAGSLGYARLADFIVCDDVVLPKEDALHFAERRLVMPVCYQPNDPTRRLTPPPAREQCGLREGKFVYCSFNQAWKITPDVFEDWCEVLRTAEDAVLWLIEPPDDRSAVTRNLRVAAARCGVNPSRIVFAPRLSHEEHLSRLQLADVALDTFPYGSHTTASDAVWAGVPLVSRKGGTFSSRVSASILGALDLLTLVSTSRQEYRYIALKLWRDRDALSSYRDRLRSLRTSSPLFNARKFAGDLETIFSEAWAARAAAP